MTRLPAIRYASLLALALLLWAGSPVSAQAQDNAQFISQSVPSSMTAGQTYAVTITMKNSGTTTWTVGTYYLRSQNPQDTVNWGLNRVELPNNVAPGENVTFAFNVIPGPSGWTNFQWIMAQGTTNFGAATTNLFLNVSGTNNAAFVSQNVLSSMAPGQVSTASITMKNTGNTTWSAANNYRMYSRNPDFNAYWGTSRLYLPTGVTVAPGQSYTFTRNITARSTPGTYNFQWRMVREGIGGFGPDTPSVQVVVGTVDNAGFVSQTVPSSLTAGQSYPVSVTMTNNGSTTWTVGTYYLRSQNPQDNVKWGLNRVELPNNVAPGQNVTFSFNIVPAIAAWSNFQWTMAQGTTNFGTATDNLFLNVSGNDHATFVSQTVPEMMTPGQVYPVSITLQNTGNTTWSEADHYRLYSENPAWNLNWGVNRAYLPSSVAPGASVTFNFNATAPTTPGIYNFQWKMIREGYTTFFDLTPNVQVSVGSVNNAQYISQTIPGTIIANQPAPIAITMRNNGSNTWTVGDYYLRSQNPQDNVKWGLNRVELPNNVAPGETVTFNFNVSPPVDGWTNFQWIMAQGSANFGEATPNQFINIGGVNNAAFVSQSVPAVMVPGEVYAVSVTMQNTGDTTWSAADNYRLTTQNPYANTNWGPSQIYVPGTVPPGASVTFSYNITAPSTAGTYNFQWMMVRNSVFGTPTPNVAVAVNGVNDSQFISQSVPATMAPSQSYPVSVTLQNTGTSVWTPGNYFLGSENPEGNTTWGLNHVDLTAEVLPGASVTLNFNVTAPSATGAYDFQWRMVQNSTRFGTLTTNVSVNVQQAQAMALYFVHTDHLNTPRLVADAAGMTVWRWDQAEPFGDNPANDDPDGNSVAFDLPLRLTGQRYDQETGLHYNYFRDYDPSLGRYVQNDPLGLQGGLNTFAYVTSSPLYSIDPFGLKPGWPDMPSAEQIQEAVKGAIKSGKICLGPNENDCNPLRKKIYDFCTKSFANVAAGLCNIVASGIVEDCILDIDKYKCPTKKAGCVSPGSEGSAGG